MITTFLVIALATYKTPNDCFLKFWKPVCPFQSAFFRDLKIIDLLLSNQPVLPVWRNFLR